MTHRLSRLAILAGAVGAQDKPNILVIWGDDVGWSNISAYNLGMMGYETPNMPGEGRRPPPTSSLARAGVAFVDGIQQERDRNEDEDRKDAA